MKTFEQWTFDHLIETAGTARYSVEVNYRSTLPEVLDGFAKIALGYVSAVMKRNEYTVKQVFEEKPFRILVSTGNWRDGEWVGLVSYNPNQMQFVISAGYYRKENNSVSIVKSSQTKSQSAAEIARDLMNLMHVLKHTPDQYKPPMKPVPLKRGPK